MTAINGPNFEIKHYGDQYLLPSFTNFCWPSQPICWSKHITQLTLHTQRDSSFSVLSVKFAAYPAAFSWLFFGLSICKKIKLQFFYRKVTLGRSRLFPAVQGLWKHKILGKIEWITCFNWTYSCTLPVKWKKKCVVG